jgi:PST family polysaccharide transporter
MLRFGGTLTLNNLVVYAAYNFEKILLGRYFGTDALGLYSRAYELINLPTRIFNSAVGSVAFSALSRLQGDPIRFKNYFLKGYSLVLSVTLPTTIFCAALADDIILVVLGPKWTEAALIFKLLAPTILVFGIINPFAWLLQSTGLHRRSLHLAFVIAPLAIGSYLIGIPFGPAGVALAYSTALSLWVVPHVFWCLHGTSISVRDLLPTVGRPLFSGAAAAVVGIGIQYLAEPIPYPLVRLMLAGTAMLAVYVWALLFVMKQKSFYVDLLRVSRGLT